MRHPVSVEEYLDIGCGRCSLGETPECKVHKWPQEFSALRRIVLDCGLAEEIKWDVPCYTWNGKNILIIAAMKTNCTISFFKGAALSDSANLLTKPGAHTNAARLIRFTDLHQIIAHADELRNTIFEAIELERAGVRIPSKALTHTDFPKELLKAFRLNPELETAFNTLTPGRQREYVLYFSQAKQEKTRVARIEKYKLSILNGKGFQDK